MCYSFSRALTTTSEWNVNECTRERAHARVDSLDDPVAELLCGYTFCGQQCRQLDEIRTHARTCEWTRVRADSVQDCMTELICAYNCCMATRRMIER